MTKNVKFLLEISITERLRLLRYGVLSKKYKKVSRRDLISEFLIKNCAIIITTGVSTIGILATNVLGEVRYVFVSIFLCGATVTLESIKKSDVQKRKIYDPQVIIFSVLQEFKLTNTVSFNQENLQEIKFHLDFRNYFEGLQNRGYITPKEFRMLYDIKLWVDMVSSDYKFLDTPHENFGKDGFQNRMVAKIFLLHRDNIEKLLTYKVKKHTMWFSKFLSH